MLVNSNSALGTLRSQVNHKHTFVCLTSRKPHLLFVSREPGYCACGQWLPCVLKNCVRMILSLLLQGETSHATTSAGELWKWTSRTRTGLSHQLLPPCHMMKGETGVIIATSVRVDVSSKLLGLNRLESSRNSILK